MAPVLAVGRAGYFYPRSPCGERPSWIVPRCSSRNFYPRSPCGERHGRIVKGFLLFFISIHALLAESDPLASGTKTILAISIHALLAESDSELIINIRKIIDFYPRSPCGERQD